MPYEETSAVYHLDVFRRIPPGKLVHVEDHDGGLADIYFHPLHIREPLVWQINWLSRHQVGYGLWRQRWTHEGRMLEPAEGRGVAVSRWEIVSASEMPSGHYVFPIEVDGSCIWLIHRRHCTVDLRDAMNQILKRIAGDALWYQPWDEEKRITPTPANLSPLVEPQAPWPFM